jgi:uncharacterized membrane protein
VASVSRLRRAAWIATIFLAVIGLAVALRRIVLLIPIVTNGYRAPGAATNPRLAHLAAINDVFAHYPALTLIHIIPGTLFMLLGPLQLSSTIRARHPRWHRVSGRIVVVCGLIIGVSALVMSFAMPAIGGRTQAAATVLFGIFFLFALGKGFWHIRKHEIALHREWMIRAFAIGLAVATVRPIVGLFFATSRFSGLTPYEFFGAAFWTGFVLHLVAAEAWIRNARPSLKYPPASTLPRYSG